MLSQTHPVASRGNVKFCYIDETGTDGRAPVVVFVGIIADAVRVHRTRREFDEIFSDFAELPAKPIQELKGSNIYYGKGRWQGVPGEDRHAAMTRLFNWISDRQHRLALSAIPVDGFESSAIAELTGLDIWMAGATHIALQVQKTHQALRSNKGSTVLIFDDQKAKADSLGDLLYDPPAWSDSYYNRSHSQEAVDQIVDTAYFARSHRTGLVQAADVIAFAFRRYSELNDFHREPAYAGEPERINGWIETLSNRLLARSNRWITRSTSEIAMAYSSCAPPSLMDLRG